MNNAMHDERYATTRQLTTKKPACFDTPVEGLTTLLKTPDSEQKAAEGGLRLNGFYKASSEGKPLVTVITVVYNGGEYLEDTIKNVIGQDYENVEYIVVDGGSKDETLEIVRSYEHAIDYWVSESDNGIYGAMNKGIALASGSWLNFMNAGDRFVESESISLIPFQIMESFGVIYGDRIQNNQVFKALPLRILRCGVIHACHQSMFFRKSLKTNEILKYNENYKISSDYDLVARIFKEDYKFFYHNVPISIFQGGGVSSIVSKQKRKDKYQSVISNFGFMGILLSVMYRCFKGLSGK